MNKLQQVVNSFRQAFGPISPVPPDNAQYLRDQAGAIGRDVIGGVRGAVKLSPPVQYARGVIKAAQNTYKPEPSLISNRESRAMSMENVGDMGKALHAIGYLNLPAVAGGGVIGGGLSAINEYIKDGKISREDAIPIIANILAGA